MSDFPAHTSLSAPSSVRPFLQKIESRYGFIPTMYAKQAEAPALLNAYQAIDKVFETASFSPMERQVVMMTISREHSCDFCMTAHTWHARALDFPDKVVEGLRNGTSMGDDKLDALAAFTSAMVKGRGQVLPDELSAFLAAGYSQQQALEVVLGIATKVMTNYTNSLARTEPNPEFGMENFWPDRSE